MLFSEIPILAQSLVFIIQPYILSGLSLFYQFRSVGERGGGGGDGAAVDGGVRGSPAGGVRPPGGLSSVLPGSLSQDPLTLATLTLLLGGWLAFALTYPSVSTAWAWNHVCVGGTV